MWLESNNDLRCTLARGAIDDSTGVATAYVAFRYRIKGDQLEETASAPPAHHGKLMRRPLTLGTGVTLAGMVAPDSSGVQGRLRLAAGNSINCELAVSGDRRWMRRGGTVVGSAPEPFDTISLSWDRAYGGKAVMKAEGPYESTDLELPYSMNPIGRGYVFDERLVDGVALPNVELASETISDWRQQPTPGGTSPCEPGALTSGADARADGIFKSLALSHLGSPRYLTTEENLEQKPITVRGLVTGPLSLRLPRRASTIALTRGMGMVTSGLRAIHLDASGATLDIIEAHGFAYKTRTAPAILKIERAPR
jgi:hypothetical protein